MKQIKAANLDLPTYHQLSAMWAHPLSPICPSFLLLGPLAQLWSALLHAQGYSLLLEWGWRRKGIPSLPFILQDTAKKLLLPMTWFKYLSVQFSSVQFSCSVMSDSSRPHESQHTRPPCPSPTPGVRSDSRPSSQ